MLKKVGRCVCLLIVLFCLIACSPDVILQDDTDTTSTNHTNGSSQSNDNNGSSSNNVQPNNNDPTNNTTTPTNPITPNPVSPEDVNPIIDIRSREIIELKEETEEIEGVVYTTKHCVDVHTSTPYFYTYYIFYYSGETLVRCRYWNREPGSVLSLIPYTEFGEWLKTNMDNYDNGYSVDCIYYSNGRVEDVYQSNYAEVVQSYTHYCSISHTHYLEDGRRDYFESIFETDQLSQNIKYIYDFYDSNAIKSVVTYTDEKISSCVVYNENGPQLISIRYNSGSIYDVTSYYESRREEYYYYNGVLKHYSDSENPITTKTNMSNSEIEEWIDTYISEHCGSLE